MAEHAAQPQVIVAGHVCLDLIPSFPQRDKVTLAPGTLVQIGATTFSTGGVSNTAVALHRLGVPTKFIGKVGDDQFGLLIKNLLGQQSKLLSDGVQITPGEISSYTYVINPPGVDRMFLHCPGANDTFNDHDVPYDQLSPATIFHFGYPPLMKSVRANSGAALLSILKQVKSKGLITSLDLTYPDPQSDAGRMNWRRIFQDIGPHLDLFLPSIDELLQMLDRPRFDAIIQQHGHIDIVRDLDLNIVSRLADELLAMGIAIVAIKLGDQGLYLKTSRDEARVTGVINRIIAPSPGTPGEGWGEGSSSQTDHPKLRTEPSPQPSPTNTWEREKEYARVESWIDRELLAPCFEVEVIGTTGAGDCTIAGFLAAILRNESPETALVSATAVGACCCEKPDATSGVQPWELAQARINDHWKQRDLTITRDGWTKQEHVWTTVSV